MTKNAHKILFATFVFIFLTGIGSIGIAGYFDRTIIQRVIKTVNNIVTGADESEDGENAPAQTTPTGNTGGTGSSATTPSTPSPTTATPSANTTAPAPTASGYTAAQVSTHSSSSDCWIIVSGSVYNLGNYPARHPGGNNIPCGTNATSAFGSFNHSGAAKSLLQNFFAGPLI